MKKSANKPRRNKKNLRIEDEIKIFIVALLRLDIDPDEIEDRELLFGGGLGLDSVKTLEIVSWMEQEYSIEIKDEDITQELFDSVQTLADYIKGHEKYYKIPRKINT